MNTSSVKQMINQIEFGVAEWPAFTTVRLGFSVEDWRVILAALRTSEPTRPSGGDAGAEAMRRILIAAWPVDTSVRRLSSEVADQILVTPEMNVTVGDLRTLLNAIRRALPQDQAPRQGGEG